VIVGRVADAGDHGAPLGQRRLHTELAVIAVEIIDVLRDDLASKILPGAESNAIARIDGLCAGRYLGAKISTPGLAACPRRLRQYLALTIRSFQASEVGTLARPGAGDEKGHIRRLRRLLLRLARDRAKGHNPNRRNNRKALGVGHRRLRF